MSQSNIYQRVQANENSLDAAAAQSNSAKGQEANHNAMASIQNNIRNTGDWFKNPPGYDPNNAAGFGGKCKSKKYRKSKRNRRSNKKCKSRRRH